MCLAPTIQAATAPPPPKPETNTQAAPATPESSNESTTGQTRASTKRSALRIELNNPAVASGGSGLAIPL